MNGKAALLVAAVALAACSRRSAPEEGATFASAVSATPQAPQTPGRAVVLDAVEGLDACDLAHRGPFLDFGAPSMRGRYASRFDAPDVETVEHDGATWARVRTRSTVTSFYWAPDAGDAPAAPPDGGTSSEVAAYVEARVRGGIARSVSAYLNGKLAGSWSLAKGETRVVSARGGTATMTPGANELLLRFNGGGRAEHDVLAEVDWVHVGTGDASEPYAPPTREDVLVSATLGEESMRALSLRAPGSVTCTGWVPKGAELEAFVGAQGGDAEVELRLLRDRAAPLLLGTTRAAGGSGAAWSHVAVPIPDEALGAGEGTLAAVEVLASRAPKGARVLVAGPRVTVPAPSPGPMPASRNVVLVVESGLAPRSLALEGGPRPVPELTALAARGVSFDANRASTPLASGAVASMLTGLPARTHTLEDPDARLPRSLTTLADAARQAGVTTAMFTANPMTGPAFGFNRGWDTYAAHAPGDETPATQVFDDAAKWIDDHKSVRFLVVVHARGGHPPWDASVADMKDLPPPNYQGSIDPKRAAEVLARAKRGRFTEGDRARAWALYGIAVDAHDAALGRLLAALRGAGHEDDTTVIVTGDVSANDAAAVPSFDTELLDEAVLATPLVVRTPSGALAGRHVSAPTTSVDLARSVMDALGLAPPASFQGEDLWRVATGGVAGRPLSATWVARFATRWGPLVLDGTRERETKLCDLSLEPTCVTDLRPLYPLGVEALHRFTVDAMAPRPEVHVEREPAFLDATTAAALRAWGRQDHADKDRD